MKIIFEFENPSKSELALMMGVFTTLSSSSSAQVDEKQASSSNKLTAASSTPTPTPAAKADPPERKIVEAVARAEKEDDLVGEEDEELTLDGIKQKVAEKAKAGHRDAIRAELDRIGASSASAVKPEQFSAFWKFLNELK